MKLSILFLQFVLTLMLLMQDLVKAQTTIIQPAGNVYVQGGINANTNYYTEPSYLLRVRGVVGDNERKTLLKYDLTNITEDFTKAELYITVNRAVGSPSDFADLFAISDDSWDETTVTWNTAPARGNFLLEREFLRKTSTMPDTVYTLDITAYVKSEMLGNKIVSIFLQDTAYRGTDLRFWSNRTLIATGPELYLKSGPLGSVSLISPTGGESWAAGSTQQITWTSNNVNNIKIDFSTNNGNSWNLVEASIPAASGSYSWLVPSVSSSHLCKVRISDAGDPSTYDINDSVFVITNPVSSITLNSPNGAEIWIVGSNQTIRWSASLISNVKVEYTVDDGSNWNSIVESISASTSSYVWNVPALPSILCKIKISDIADPTLIEMSANNFSIVEASQDNIVAVDQIYVKAGISADSNYVTETLLRVRGDSVNINNQRKTYVKFDLSNRTENIDRAEMKMTVYQVPTSGTRSDIFTVSNDNWSESTVTWNTAPPRENYLISQNFPLKPTTQPDIEYSWDVTSYVNSEFSGDKIVSFCLVDTLNNGSDVRFGSDRGFVTGPRLALFRVTDVEDEINLHPNEFNVLQNYPNPFNPETKITYNLPSQGQVKITIYDILGNTIQELVNEVQQTGLHQVIWKASSVPSGIYFSKIQFSNNHKIVKMVLLK